MNNIYISDNSRKRSVTGNWKVKGAWIKYVGGGQEGFTNFSKKHL